MAKKITNKELFIEVVNFLIEKNAPEELVTFIDSRIDQLDRAAKYAKEARAKNGGEPKDPAQSDFYVNLRDKLTPVLTQEAQSGKELLAQIDNVTPNGKEYLVAQISLALKPLVEAEEVVVERKVYTVTGSNGLQKETLLQTYRLA